MPSPRIYFGVSTVSPVSDNIILETRTLSNVEVISRQLTLSNTPLDSANITAWVDGGSTFLPTVDFSLSGAMIDWSVSGYATRFSAGDIIQFIYKKV